MAILEIASRFGLSLTYFVIFFQVVSHLESNTLLKKGELDGNSCPSTRDVNWKFKCQE